MGILQSIEGVFVTTVNEVNSILLDIKTGLEVAEKDVAKAMNWIVSQAPTIAADIKQVETWVEVIAASNPGFAQNAIVTQAIADANEAVAGLNAMATAANTGSDNVTAFVDGYAAIQKAAASVAGAKAAVISAPTKAAA